MKFYFNEKYYMLCSLDPQLSNDILVCNDKYPTLGEKMENVQVMMFDIIMFGIIMLE